MNDKFICLKNVVKSYDSGNERLTILDGINLNIPAGKITTITGESGCGKSTFLNLVGGLDKVTAGHIFFQDDDISTMDEDSLTNFRNEKVGFIFQFHYLLKEFSALENIMIPALIKQYNWKKAKKKALGLLELVGLKKRSHHKPGELSGGEQQRIAIARALINDPDLILADEPTGNLDEKNTGIIAELLFSIVRNEKKTLILVSHEKKLTQEGDMRFILCDGQLHEIN